MAYDDEIILDSFKRNNKTNQTSKNKNIENLKVREENVKKATKKNKKNKNPRLTLKKVATATLAALVLSGAGAIATKIYRDVKIPVGFDYSGTSISSTSSLPDEINDDFVLIEVNSWKKGISERSIENIKKCNEKGVPCGILLNSDATTEKEATADAACILALTEDDKIECPIYYNIDGIVGKVPDEKLIEICTAFYEMCRGASVGIGAKEDTLDKIKEDLPNELKLMAISDGKEINNSEDYSICYFERVGKYFSEEAYGKEVEKQQNNSVYINEEVTSSKETQTAIKGIDVSQYQGDIDWEKVKEEGVNYAIIRFTAFSGFHENGNLNIDDKFYENVAECTRLGIPYGIYCYTKAESEAEAKAEASALIKRLKGTGIDKNLDLPIYYDIEMKKHFDNPELSANLAKAFCKEIDEAGYSSGIYASYSLLKDMVNVDPTLKDYEKWVARYKYDNKRGYDEVTKDHIPDVSDLGKVGVVQVTQNATLEGIKGNTVDTNFDVTGISAKVR